MSGRPDPGAGGPSWTGAAGVCVPDLAACPAAGGCFRGWRWDELFVVRGGAACWVRVAVIKRVPFGWRPNSGTPEKRRMAPLKCDRARLEKPGTRVLYAGTGLARRRDLKTCPGKTEPLRAGHVRPVGGIDIAYCDHTAQPHRVAR